MAKHAETEEVVAPFWFGWFRGQITSVVESILTSIKDDVSKISRKLETVALPQR